MPIIPKPVRKRPAAPGIGTAVTLKALVRIDVVELPAQTRVPQEVAGGTKSIWSLSTPSTPIGAKSAVVEPGEFRLKVTPLLKISDTLATPSPVVLPARAKNASLMRKPLIPVTVYCQETSA